MVDGNIGGFSYRKIAFHSRPMGRASSALNGKFPLHICCRFNRDADLSLLGALRLNIQAEMVEDFHSTVEQNSPDFPTQDELPQPDDFFDFDAASEGVDGQPQGDTSSRVEEEHLDTANVEVDGQEYREILTAVGDLYGDSSDDDGLYDETVGPTRGIDEEEPCDEDDVVVKADGVRLWKIDHSTGDHKLKRW